MMAVCVLGIVSFATAQEEKTNTPVDTTAQTISLENNFEKIDKSQLPQAIKDAIMNDMDGMKVMEAYIGEDSIYMIVVAAMNNEADKKTVYADADGNWVKPKND